MFNQPEPDPMFEQAGDEYDAPIKNGLEQDRTDQRRAIVMADGPHRVGDQHRFPDDERRRRRKHEIAELLTVIGENEVRGQQYQIKADKKEDRRRQDF